MQNVLDWIKANPMLTLMIWGLLTSAVSFLWGKAEGSPKLHGFAMFMEGLGLDPRKILAGLGKMFGVPPSDPPAVQTNLKAGQGSTLGPRG